MTNEPGIFNDYSSDRLNTAIYYLYLKSLKSLELFYAQPIFPIKKHVYYERNNLFYY